MRAASVLVLLAAAATGQDLEARAVFTDDHHVLMVFTAWKAIVHDGNGYKHAILVANARAPPVFDAPIRSDGGSVGMDPFDAVCKGENVAGARVDGCRTAHAYPQRQVSSFGRL